MSEIKQETPVVETKPVENVAPVEAAPAPVEPPKPQLAAGLFKDYTLGSRLAPGQSGNVMTNLKTSPMDYEKKYEGATRNQSLSAEQLSQIKQAPVKTPQIGNKPKS